MKYLLNTSLKVSLLICAVLGVSACGQKGPLIVDQPPVDIVTTQEKELEQTK